jgi:hypothetical protein
MNIKWLCIISGGLLLLGIPTGWPYSYYILLRWIISIASIFIAYSFYNSKLQAWALIFGAVAILFNPIVPIYFAKSTWVIFDFIGACLFFIAAFSKKKIKTI